MDPSRKLAAGSLFVALCLVSSVLSAPFYYLAVAPGYQGGYDPQGLNFPRQQRQQQPIYYTVGASPSVAASAANPSGSATSLKYLAVSHPQATPNQRYVVAPYLSPGGYVPVTLSQVSGLGPQGYQDNNQFLIYPAGTEYLRQGERPGVLQSIFNFFQNLIPNRNPEKPAESEQKPAESPANEVQGSTPEGADVASPNAQPASVEGSDSEMVVPVVSQVINPNVETIISPNVETAASPNIEEAETAEASETLVRQMAMSRAFNRKEGEAEEESEVIEEQEEEEEEEEAEEDDSVVIGPGGSNPSVAQAKPAAIALAGVGGVAAAAPTATAVVGANGLAVAAPSATAVAGPSAGSAPPGLLPKGTKVRPSKVSPEEAKINAAKIQAARQSAYDMVAGLRIAGMPSIPFLPYRV